MTRPTPPRSTHEVRIHSVRDGHAARRRDVVAVEEPLEVRIRHAEGEANLGLTMRTPGHDEELVAGLLLSEGVVGERRHLAGFRHGSDRDGAPDANVLVAELAPDVAFDPRATERLMMRSSACGVCGRASLDALRLRRPPRAAARAPLVPDAVLRSLPAKLRRRQDVFEATGGLHAAALFDERGRLRSLREDVGRHNAVDKLLGAEFLARRVPVRRGILLVSGRASFEILQKALMAGVRVLAAVGAPSSLATELAADFGLTLVGFLKPTGYNVYSGAGRIPATFKAGASSHK